MAFYNYEESIHTESKQIINKQQIIKKYPQLILS